MTSTIAEKPIIQYIAYGFKIMICLASFALALLAAFFILPARQHYHIHENFLFSGTTEKTTIFLGVLTPKSGPYQSVREKEIQWPDDQQIEEYEFVDASRISGTLAPQETKSVIIEYEVTLRQSTTSWVAPIEAYQTLPQEGIESDHHTIQERASSLNNHSFRNTAYKIYAFTSDYLSYAEVLEDCVSSSALRSYEIGSCICAGYARLMVALSRASDIPAQVVIGFTYPDPIVKRGQFENGEHPGKPHAWVEFNAFGKWTMADPTLGSGLWKRLFFGRNDGRHILYGELEQIAEINQRQKFWVLENADYPVGDFECFRYKITSSSPHISLTAISTVQKVWDGRWLNTILFWALITLLLCKYRSRLLPRNIKLKY